MRHRKPMFVVAFVAFSSTLGLSAVPSRAQKSQPASESASAAPEKPYDWKASFAKVPTGKVPRMADGKPDLQGIWNYSILTPLQRPNNEKNTEIAAAEVEEIETEAHQAAVELRVEPTVTPPGEKTTDAYNSFWREGYWYKVPMTTLHTSQIVDPPSGLLPPLTPAARARREEVTLKMNRPATGPEDRPIPTRCVRGARSGPPIIGQGPGSQETTFQIVQSPQTVVVRLENMHESQIIPLSDSPRPPENIHLDKGAARGHWEGDTLVVESTNFKDWGIGVFSAYGTTDQLHLTERWKRLDDTHLLYGFTIEDPGTWTRPWSAEFVVWRLTDQEQLNEYSCHEGNVGLEFALSGARSKEIEKAKRNSNQQ